MRSFETDEIVAYSKQKWSDVPGPRARDVVPASVGDTYTYCVTKFWRVVEKTTDGSLLVETRRGKRRLVQSDDPSLRRPTLIERLLLQSKFPRNVDPAALPDGKATWLGLTNLFMPRIK